MIFDINNNTYRITVNGTTVRDGLTLPDELTSERNPTCFNFLSGETRYGFNGKMYFIDIFDTETPVFTLIPALRKSDTVAGMYDTVENVFYTNIRSGAFGYEKLDGTYVAPV